MSATVKIGRDEATIDGYQWASKNKTLARLLNSMLDPLGPSGADPHPDLTAAREAAKELGGKVVRFDEVDHVAGRIY